MLHACTEYPPLLYTAVATVGDKASELSAMSGRWRQLARPTITGPGLCPRLTTKQLNDDNTKGLKLLVGIG